MANTIPAVSTGASGDIPSPALYISGFVGTAAAIWAINTVLGISLMASLATMLAFLGYMFSYAARWVGVPPKLLSWAAFLVTAYLVYRLASGQSDIASLVPVTAGQGDLQLAVVIQWLAVIYSWALTDDRRVVLAAMVAVAMIGLVASYNPNSDLLTCFLIYVLSTLFLLIHHNFLLHQSWGRREGPARANRLLTAQVALAATTGLFALLAATIVVVPIEAVGKNLSLGGALSSLADFAHVTAVGPQSPSSLGSTTFPIGQGDGFSASDQIVMHVYPSDGQEHLWRGETFDEYTGSGWVSTLASDAQAIEMRPEVQGGTGAQAYSLPPVQANPLPPRSLSARLSTRFDVVDGLTDELCSVPAARVVEVADSTPIVVHQDGRIGLLSPSGLFSYTVVSDVLTASPMVLRRDTGGPIPPQIRTLDIDQVGSDVSAADRSRLQQTATAILESLPPARQDEFDRAEAIRSWVSRQCLYNLDVPAIPQGVDPVSYFLFSSRQGYCDMFASAMVILCRYAGIPARIATGWAPGARRNDGGFDVRVRDKHAWCEVYFPGYGWSAFDPTIGSALASDDRKPRSEGLSRWWDQLIASLNARLRRMGELPKLAVATVILCVGYIGFVEGYGRRALLMAHLRFSRKPSSRPVRGPVTLPEARAAAIGRWTAVRKMLARYDVRQRPAETAREFSARAATFLRALTGPGDPPVSVDDAQWALRTTAESYLIARYSREDERLKLLMDREDTDASEQNLSAVASYLAWGRRSARELARRPGRDGSAPAEAPQSPDARASLAVDTAPPARRPQ